MKTITMASTQWRTRPADQQFGSMEELDKFLVKRKENSKVDTFRLADLKLAADGDNLVFDLGGANFALPNSWSMRQFCNVIKAPLAVLTDLPIENTLADTQVYLDRRLNDNEDLRFQTMTYQNGGDPILRCINPITYARVWDKTTFGWLKQAYDDNGWTTSLGTAKDARATPDLYAGPEDSFWFVMDPTRTIDGGDEELYRGVIVWNSEVYRRSFGYMTFLFERICQNHIIWGTKSIEEVSIHHYGQGMQDRAKQKFFEFVKSIALPVTAEERAIRRAKKARFGKTEEDTEKALQALKFLKKDARAIINHTEQVNRDPTNVWDVIFAITQLSQKSDYANVRSEMDVKAGKLLQAYA